MPDTITHNMIRFLLSTFLVCYLITKVLVYLFKKRKWQFPHTLNYKHETIPTGYGILFPWYLYSTIISLATLLIYAALTNDYRPVTGNELFHVLEAFVPVFVMLVGYYDDAKGQKNIKGLRKNLSVFFTEKKLTSSLIKALVIVSGAFTSSLLYRYLYAHYISFSEVAVNTLLIALFTNFFNLLDVRPGRLIKVSFLFFMGLFSLFLVNVAIYNIGNNKVYFTLSKVFGVDSMQINFIITPVFATVAAYAPLDFRGQAMMGDAGSNFLGFVIGSAFATMNLYPKIFLILLLFAFHIYCEFYSFSDFISRNKILRWLDEWGTCMRKDGKQENKAGSDTGDV